MLQLGNGAEIHAKLQELSLRLDAEKVFFRLPVRAHEKLQPDPISEHYAVSDRDRAVCGLIAKAVQTHKSIGLLVAAGQVSDAVALARVLLENAFSLSWVLLEPEFRIDLYWLSSITFQRRLAELVLAHYPANEGFAADAQEVLGDKKAEKLSALLDDNWRGWARVDDKGKSISIGAKGIFAGVGVTNPDGSKSTFAYDVVYFVHSHHIHSTVESTRGKYGLTGASVFSVQPGRNLVAGEVALGGANVSLVQVLAETQKHIRSDIFEPQLSELWEQMKVVLPALGGAAATGQA